VGGEIEFLEKNNQAILRQIKRLVAAHSPETLLVHLHAATA
jgi:hypothetical protein